MKTISISGVKKSLFFLIGAMFFFLPLVTWQFKYYPVFVSEMKWAFASAVLFVSAVPLLLITLKKKGCCVGLDLADIALFCCVGFIGLSSLINGGGFFFYNLSGFLILWIFYILGRFYDLNFRRNMWLLSLGILLSAVFYILQKKTGTLSILSFFEAPEEAATFSSTSNLAISLVLTMPFFYYLSIRTNEHKRMLSLAAFVFAFIAVIFCGSLSAMIPAFCFLFLGALNEWGKISVVSKKIKKRISVGFVVVIACCIVIGIPTIVKQENNSIKHRFAIWEASVASSFDRVVFGNGPGGFVLRGAKYFPIEDKQDLNDIPPFRTLARSSHNDLLEIFSAGGIFAVMAWVSFFALIILKCLRLRKGLSIDTLWLVMIIAAFIIMGLFHSVTTKPVPAILVFYLSGVFLRQNEDQYFKLNRRVIPFLLLIVIVLSFILLVPAAIGNISISKAHLLVKEGHSQRAQKLLIKAQRQKPFEFLSFVNLGNIYLREEKYQEAIDVFEKGLQVNPYDANLHNSLGTVFFLIKDYYKARDHYENAVHYNPLFSGTRYNLANVYMMLDQLGKAREELEIVMRLAPDDEDAKRLLRQINYSLKSEDK